MSKTPITHPGRTSCVQLPGGTMTFQTELRGEPPELVTVIDFRGKVVRRVTRRLSEDDWSDVERAVRLAHSEVERSVCSSLESLRAAKRGTEPASAVEPTAAALFVMALEVLHRGDRGSAAALLHTVSALLPHDPRVDDLLHYLRSQPA